MKSLFFRLLLLLLAVRLNAANYDNYFTTNPNPAALSIVTNIANAAIRGADQVTILVLGDSTLANGGTPGFLNWANQLQTNSAWAGRFRIVNISYPGWSVSTLNSGFETYLRRFMPVQTNQIVVAIDALGINADGDGSSNGIATAKVALWNALNTNGVLVYAATILATNASHPYYADSSTNVNTWIRTTPSPLTGFLDIKSVAGIDYYDGVHMTVASANLIARYLNTNAIVNASWFTNSPRFAGATYTGPVVASGGLTGLYKNPAFWALDGDFWSDGDGDATGYSFRGSTDGVRNQLGRYTALGADALAVRSYGLPMHIFNGLNSISYMPYATTFGAMTGTNGFTLTGGQTNTQLTASQFVSTDGSKALTSTLNGLSLTNVTAARVETAVSNWIAGGTSSLTNKTIDAADNVLKFKSYIYLTHPHMSDGTGAILGTNELALDYGHATFSNSADEGGNYVEYRLQVPTDVDTSVAMRAKLKFRLNAGDTGTHRYTLNMASVADSAAAAGTVGTPINLDFAGDGSGASGDVETVGYTTLTGWAAAVTADRLWVIRLARDGNASQDASTQNSAELGLVIEYGATQ